MPWKYNQSVKLASLFCEFIIMCRGLYFTLIIHSVTDQKPKPNDELSKPQTEQGCKYVSELNIPGGANVLDMDCGTGYFTKYIADIVGSAGAVVGDRPERIKIVQVLANEYKSFAVAQIPRYNLSRAVGVNSGVYINTWLSLSLPDVLSQDTRDWLIG